MTQQATLAFFWEPTVGERCVVARVYHEAHVREVGTLVIVERVNHVDGRAVVWARPDREICRRARGGREVVERPCWTTLYLADQLDPVGSA